MKDISWAWENIKEKIKTSEKQSRSVRFDEECSQFLDEKKEAQMRWLQDQTKEIFII